MKTRTTKRVLTLVLAIVLTFVLAVSAFATWSSFQGRNTNNGKITSGQPPISPTPTATPVPLDYNNPDGSVYTGVDAASVIQSNYAFTLYNGGVTNGTAGGARMQATTLSTGAQYWNIQLDTDASNDNQLSTPYYDSSTNTIYVAVTYSTLLESYSSLSGWTTSGASINSGIATFTAGNQSVSGSFELQAPVHTLYVPTNLVPSNANYTVDYSITLTDTTYNTVYPLVTNDIAKYSTWPGTYFTYNGGLIPVGEYTLTITVNSIDLIPDQEPVSNVTASLSSVSLTRYDWRLYSVSSVLTQSPVKSSVLASGEGQINTHINSVGKYLYFGGWGGTHSYYQYGPIDGTASLTAFTPAVQEDFYYAGASKVSENSTSNVVFGSESGKVYVRPVGPTFGSATGNVIDLASTQPACGPIRSSICVVGSTWYLTSRGPLPSEVDSDDPNDPDPKGYLWKITGGTTPTLLLQLDGNTSSTPVVSSNGYLYVGYYSGYNDGGVIAVDTDYSLTPEAIEIFISEGIHISEPVQSSPIVYSDGTDDYIYFTTNSFSGAGYCSYFDTTDPENEDNGIIWSAGGTSGNPFAVQGFSSENGYLVYGDDGNYLYIIH